MSYSQAWLEDPSSIKALFIEVTVLNSTNGGSTWASKTMYMSTVGYVTNDAETVFNPILVGKIRFKEAISGDRASLSYGDVEIHNSNGDYDDWLDTTKYIWINKNINMYLGDPFWISADLTDFKSKFKLIFTGSITDIDSKSLHTLNIKFADKLQRLNFPITETKLGAYGTWAEGQSNEDSIKPLIFGEPYNITPVYVDPSQLEYMICGENLVERIIEVRDNGIPIYSVGDFGTPIYGGIVHSGNNGTFKLLYNPAGTITVTAQGISKHVDLTSGTTTVGTLVNSYSNNIAEIIALLVTQYGNSTQKFTSSDLDLTSDAPSLVNFAQNNNQTTGIYITSAETVLTVCTQLAASVGATLVISKEGKLQLVKYGQPFTTGLSISSITTDNIVQNSFSIRERVDIKPSCTIGYCKNWTVQQGLVTSIPDQNKKDFATEYLTYTAEVPENTKVLFNLTLDPKAQINTLLLETSDAITQAVTQRNIYSSPMNIYSFKGTSSLLSLKLGQSVTLTYPRFGLNNGKQGQVISLSQDWLGGTVDVEVLVL